MKKFITSLLLVVVLLTTAFALVGCSAGTYYLKKPLSDEVFDDVYIKLGAFGTIEIKCDQLEAVFELKDNEKISYKVEDDKLKVIIKGKDADGNKSEIEIPLGITVKDGELKALGGLLTFKKK